MLHSRSGISSHCAEVSVSGFQASKLKGEYVEAIPHPLTPSPPWKSHRRQHNPPHQHPPTNKVRSAHSNSALTVPLSTLYPLPLTVTFHTLCPVLHCGARHALSSSAEALNAQHALFEASKHLRQWFVDLQVTFHVAEPLHPMISDAPACRSAHARSVDQQRSDVAAVPTLCSVPWGGGARSLMSRSDCRMRPSRFLQVVSIRPRTGLLVTGFLVLRGCVKSGSSPSLDTARSARSLRP